MKLFDAGKIISSSLGMAVAMSLSSLFFGRVTGFPFLLVPFTAPMAWGSSSAL